LRAANPAQADWGNTRHLLESPDQPDPKQSASLQEQTTPVAA
jgi:hypothetical protein